MGAPNRYGAQDQDAATRSRQSLAGRALYWVVWRLIYALMVLMFRFRVTGRGNLPDGPFILSGVHRSFIDSPVVGMVTSRRLRFMGKESLWDSKPLGVFLSTMGGFPVERGTADRLALRAAQDVLAMGEPLVMFPEGTRQEGSRVDPDLVLEGPAFVAARAGVPIVPVGIGGSARALPIGVRVPRPAKIVAVVGEPIYPPASEGGRVPRRVVAEMTGQLVCLLYTSPSPRDA